MLGNGLVGFPLVSEIILHNKDNKVLSQKSHGKKKPQECCSEVTEKHCSALKEFGECILVDNSTESIEMADLLNIPTFPDKRSILAVFLVTVIMTFKDPESDTQHLMH